MAKRTTVIDIGSNSIGMVVYEKTSRFSFRILHQSKTKVRISENTYLNNGILQKEPMQRTIEALQDFISISNSFKSRKTLCIATSAVRDAPNRKEFIQKVRDYLKLNIKVIDGSKEAYYGAISAINLLPKYSENSLTIDIGGGSTEFSLIDKDNNILQTFSLDLGTIRIKELFFDTKKQEDATKYIDEKLSILKNIDASQLIGIGGTLRAISQSVMQKEKYPFTKLHAYQYSVEKLSLTITEILNAKENITLKNIGIKENRFDVIQPGALILQQVLAQLNIKNIITNKNGVKEGVYLHDMLRNSKGLFPVNYNVSLRQLIDSYAHEPSYDNLLKKLSSELFLMSYQENNIDFTYKQYLSISAKIASFTRTSLNLLDSLEYGLSHQEMLLLYAILSQNTNFMQKYESLLPTKNVLKYLIFILNLSESLLLHRPKKIDFTFKFENNTFYFQKNELSYLSKEALLKLSNKDFKIIF